MDVLLEILNNNTKPDILDIIHSQLPLDYYITLIDHTFSVKWRFVGKSTYRNGQLHSFNDEPFIDVKLNSKFWYKNGDIHRDNDKPAIIYPNDSQWWYQYNKLHRDKDKPAIIYSDGRKEWYQHSKCYRTYRP